MLSRFPHSLLIAIEPDSGNFEMLERNMRPFGSRVQLVRSGVWSHSVGLVVSETTAGDGREWSREVRPCRPGEQPEMLAVDIGSLLEKSGCDRISILKIDIERAEKRVFAENYQSWLGRVDNLVIELHDPECEQVFRQAIAPIHVPRRRNPHARPRCRSS